MSETHECRKYGCDMKAYYKVKSKAGGPTKYYCKRHGIHIKQRSSDRVTTIGDNS